MTLYVWPAIRVDAAGPEYRLVAPEPQAEAVPSTIPRLPPASVELMVTPKWSPGRQQSSVSTPKYRALRDGPLDMDMGRIDLDTTVPRNHPWDVLQFNGLRRRDETGGVVRQRGSR